MGLHRLMRADAKVFLEAFDGEVEGLGVDVTGDDDGLVEGQGVTGGLEEVVLWRCLVQVSNYGA